MRLTSLTLKRKNLLSLELAFCYFQKWGGGGGGWNKNLP